MPRARYAIALLIPEPAATEIDGLRRALGDRGIANVAPHVTLVPPVNVREEQIGEVLAHIRAVAARTTPLALRLGPPATFAPVTPVLYLSVGGDTSALRALRDGLLDGVLARPQAYDFVPHVTIQDDCDAARIDAALGALAGYAVNVRVDGVHLLRDRAPGPRRWNAVADARFEPPLVVGRGGRELEVTVSGVADPEVAARFEHEAGAPPSAEPVTVVARHDGAIVAAARGSMTGGQPSFDEVVGDREVSRLLLKAATQSAAGRS